MASNTTFIIVPGAWHPASSLEPIMEPLRAAGYNVTGIDLASFGAEPPLNDFKADIDLVSNAIEDAAEKGQDVVVFMHSYGGVVGTEACRGLGKKERKASGKEGGVIRLIFCTAFLVDEGESAEINQFGQTDIIALGVSIMDVLNNKPLPWFIVSDNGARVEVDKPEDVFYNDLSREEAQKCIDKLAHHSYRCLGNKLTYAAYKDIPTTYLYCAKDNAIPLFAQQKMVKDAQILGVDVDTLTLESSHSPFLSMPDEVVAACREAAVGKV